MRLRAVCVRTPHASLRRPGNGVRLRPVVDGARAASARPPGGPVRPPRATAGLRSAVDRTRVASVRDPAEGVRLLRTGARARREDDRDREASVRDRRAGVRAPAEDVRLIARGVGVPAVPVRVADRSAARHVLWGGALLDDRTPRLHPARARPGEDGCFPARHTARRRCARGHHPRRRGMPLHGGCGACAHPPYCICLAPTNQWRPGLKGTNTWHSPFIPSGSE